MNQIKSAKKRIFYYDIIRAFAIICIIACHTFASFASTKGLFGSNFWYYSVYLNMLRNLGVPLFVVLSGCLLIGRKDSLITFAKKRLNRVLVPYIFWGIIFILFVIFLQYIGQNYYDYGTIGNLIFSVFNINPDGKTVFFWFVPMILVTYVIIFIINKLNERYENTLKIALIISLILIVLINIDLIPKSKPYNYLYYFIFAVMGYYLSGCDLNNNKYVNLSYNKLLALFLIIAIAFYSAEILLLTSHSLSIKSYGSISQFNILNIIAVLSTFLAFRCFSESDGIINKLESSKLGKAIFSVSVCSYGIYLSHMIVKYGFYILLAPLKSQKFVYTSLTLVLTLVCSWALILILSKIPVLKRLCGV
ncbi:acyltransferase [Methanobrevibacter sp.]|uniref:acyltransferase n=1 Tax=Methanobrevibacter sp. TaxID=66852 RepID=UPI0026DFC955|nr:acyltransferase [Methanobrevibacter sp.]MDO5859353.1 acyltransferase [Methanobrevibacter sp.]